MNINWRITYIDSDYQDGYEDLDGNLRINTESIEDYHSKAPAVYLKVESDMGHIKNTYWELVGCNSVEAIYKPYKVANES